MSGDELRESVKEQEVERLDSFMLEKKNELLLELT